MPINTAHAKMKRGPTLPSKRLRGATEPVAKAHAVQEDVAVVSPASGVLALRSVSYAELGSDG